MSEGIGKDLMLLLGVVVSKEEASESENWAPAADGGIFGVERMKYNAAAVVVAVVVVDG